MARAPRKFHEVMTLTKTNSKDGMRVEATEHRISQPLGPSRVRRVAILGSTGSIGTQTLEIARLFPDRIKIVALTAGQNIALLEEQAAEFKPECVVVASESDQSSISTRFECPVFFGMEGLLRAATWDNTDIVVTALVGAIGLTPTLAAIRQGSRIALANKETMVVAGDLVQDLARQFNTEIVPIDSEHSAIFQCLLGEAHQSVEKLILTASGGPFRDRDVSTFPAITLQEALAHPNWTMGSKITIDSATMMNKGLEVIEARWLFDIPVEKIDVVIHPQSIIHSMVQFTDGSTKAQLGPPDMKVPIQLALTFPERWSAPHEVMQWDINQTMTFSAPETGKYPSLFLAYEALKAGGSMPAVLNAANEVAVDLFIREQISFSRIPILVESVMSRYATDAAASIEARIDADRGARLLAMELTGTSNH